MYPLENLVKSVVVRKNSRVYANCLGINSSVINFFSALMFMNIIFILLVSKLILPILAL